METQFGVELGWSSRNAEWGRELRSRSRRSVAESRSHGSPRHLVEYPLSLRSDRPAPSVFFFPRRRLRVASFQLCFVTLRQSPLPLTRELADGLPLSRTGDEPQKLAPRARPEGRLEARELDMTITIHRQIDLLFRKHMYGWVRPKYERDSYNLCSSSTPSPADEYLKRRI